MQKIASTKHDEHDGWIGQERSAGAESAPGHLPWHVAGIIPSIRVSRRRFNTTGFSAVLLGFRRLAPSARQSASRLRRPNLPR